MALIYFLSAQPDLATGLGVWDTVLRKLAHLTEFGLLYVLVLRAFGWRNARTAAVIAIAYAVSDELHQTAVDGRHGSLLDVLVDAAGVAIAAALRPARRAGRRAAPAPR